MPQEKSKGTGLRIRFGKFGIDLLELADSRRLICRKLDTAKKHVLCVWGKSRWRCEPLGIQVPRGVLWPLCYRATHQVPQDFQTGFAQLIYWPTRWLGHKSKELPSMSQCQESSPLHICLACCVLLCRLGQRFLYWPTVTVLRKMSSSASLWNTCFC
jgi:hypothetical protein